MRADRVASETLGALHRDSISDPSEVRAIFQRAIKERGILYAPDFLINAGGLIYVAAAYDHANIELATQHVESIYDSSMELFLRAERENIATNEVAEKIALERLLQK